MTQRLLELEAFLDSMVQRRPSLWTRSACGVTRRQREIPVLLDHDAYLPAARRARVLLVSGLSARQPDVERALEALELFAASGQQFAAGIALSAIPCGNPDGLELGTGSGNGVGGNPSTGFPPQQNFFFDQSDPEIRYLWRWVCYQAPDLVLEVLDGDPIRRQPACLRQSEPREWGTTGPYLPLWVEEVPMALAKYLDYASPPRMKNCRPS